MSSHLKNYLKNEISYRRKKSILVVHLGENVGVKSSEIIGIFDLESSTVKEASRDFLVESERKSIVTYTSEKPSRTFIVCSGKEGNRVFLTQISAKTIVERATKKNGSN